MASNQPDSESTTRAQSLRRNQTRSEGLLWSILRAKQLCNLKFRRQHPVGPWIADFACPEKMLVVEVDGEYHSETIASEMVGRAIAIELGLSYKFKKCQGTGSGMKSIKRRKQAD